MNQDIEYEVLAKEVYEEILRDDGFDTVSVQHNVKVEGRSGQKHQIDVFWEFKVAGLLHRVAVECKNYTSPVSIGRIRDFCAALDDIGCVQGIFITKTGFQSGARRFADHKGIVLKKLREPRSEDLELPPGVVRQINISGTMYYLDDVRVTLKLDFPWVEAHTSLREGDSYEIAGMANEIEILDEDNRVVASMYSLQEELARNSGSFEEFENRYKEFEFGGSYITWPDCEYGKLKIEKIGFLYNMRATTTISRTEGRYAAKAVLEDIKTGEIHLHKKETKIEVSKRNF